MILSLQRTVAVLFLFFTVCISINAQGNLLANGSFENGNIGLGLTSVPGWTITQGTVDVFPNAPQGTFTNFYQSADGTKTLELIGTPGVGGISQSFSTPPGSYRLTGFMSHHPGLVALSGANIFINGTQRAQIQHGGQITNTNMRWETFELVFTANTSTTNLTIVDRNLAGWIYGGMILDGLKVVPITGTDRPVDDPCITSGSFIGCENQSLGEEIPVVGTPFLLRYQSDKMPGRRDVSWDAREHSFLGGWTLDVHHALNLNGLNLYLGNGSTRSSEKLFLPQTTPILLPNNELLIASEDGGELYIFSSVTGRHLRTIDSLIGATIYSFQYDSLGRLVAVADGFNNITAIERNTNGIAVAIVSPYGQRTDLTYNQAGFLATVSNPAQEIFSLNYYAGTGLLSSFGSPRKLASTFQYDADGRLIQDNDSGSGYKALSRMITSDGSLVNVTTALGRISRYKVMPLADGERRITTSPEGLQTDYTRTTFSERTDSPDGTTIQTEIEREPRFGIQVYRPKRSVITLPSGLGSETITNRTVSLTVPNNPLTLSTQTDTVTVNGKEYKTTFTAANKTSITISPEGRRVKKIFDSEGKILETQAGSLAPISYTYDNRGRVKTTVQGSKMTRTTEYFYDESGRLNKTIDPEQNSSLFNHDAANRVTNVERPDSQNIAYSYDRNGNLTSITPPGNGASTFNFNQLDLRASFNAPSINPKIYSYNSDQQISSISIPASVTVGVFDGFSIKYTYDNAGRLDKVRTSKGSFDYAYESSTGQLKSIVSPYGNNNLSYEYDGSLVKSISSLFGQIRYGYDNDFRITSQDVTSAARINFTYDNDNLLTRAGSLTLTRSQANGLITGSEVGSITDNYLYNDFGETRKYSAFFTGSPIFSQEYTRDNLGRISKKIERIGKQTKTYNYVYDRVGRLIRVRLNGSITSNYSYDFNGNRSSYEGDLGSFTGAYGIGGNLITYGSASFSYEIDGKLKTKTVGNETTSYEYDDLGNLLSVRLPNSTAITYLVDGLGRRIGKKVGDNVIQKFVYGQGGSPIQEIDAQGNVKQFVYASKGHIPDYLIINAITYRIISDSLGSPRLVVNTLTGEIVQSIDYDEFGQVLSDTNPGFIPFGFAGGLYDQDTKLTRFGARDYDAVIGRWTARDPIDFDGGDTNLYGYVKNDPVNSIDLSGLEPSRVEQAFNGENEAARERFESGVIESAFFQLDDLLIVKALFVKAIGLCRISVRTAIVAEGDFFAGTKYSEKVLKQINKGDNHAFPELVKRFQGDGVVSTIKGGDGITRQILKIQGRYKGKDGVFEFIKEADGTINHRFFNPR